MRAAWFKQGRLAKCYTSSSNQRQIGFLQRHNRFGEILIIIINLLWLILECFSFIRFGPPTNKTSLQLLLSTSTSSSQFGKTDAFRLPGFVGVMEFKCYREVMKNFSTCGTLIIAGVEARTKQNTGRLCQKMLENKDDFDNLRKWQINFRLWKAGKSHGKGHRKSRNLTKKYEAWLHIGQSGRPVPTEGKHSMIIIHF